MLIGPDLEVLFPGVESSPNLTEWRKVTIGKLLSILLRQVRLLNCRSPFLPRAEVNFNRSDVLMKYPSDLNNVEDLVPRNPTIHSAQPQT